VAGFAAATLLLSACATGSAERALRAAAAPRSGPPPASSKASPTGPPASLGPTVAAVDVSNASGPQSETSVAVDPSNPRILLAGSNNIGTSTMRAYSSVDGGRTWTSRDDPPPPSRYRGYSSDPAVGIDDRGRQYFAFLQIVQEARGHLAYIFVASRTGAASNWTTPLQPISPHGANALDDKPTLTVDVGASSSRRGRVYVAWSRFGPSGKQLLLSSSDDGARTWSSPVVVVAGPSVSDASLAVSSDGDLYAAWLDRTAIWVARSTDGGRAFGPATLADIRTPGDLKCGNAFAVSIPAQPHRCVRPVPTVTVDRSTGSRGGRVYVTYANGGANLSEDVFVASFTRDLRPLTGYPTGGAAVQVNPPDGPSPSDQFLPAAAVDPSTGLLWVCFYDTGTDASRVTARFSCTDSADGGRTWAPVRPVASVPSNETRAGADTGKHGNEYGDYESVAAEGGFAHPVWTDGRSDGSSPLREEVFSATITAGPGG